MLLSAVDGLPSEETCRRTAACDAAESAAAAAASGGSGAPFSVAHRSRVFWMLKLSAISPLTHSLSWI